VKGMNMLFCDGHVSPVSVREAWSAITLKQPF
jgi:prepilin-type processing-associated H-X9-DG protein